MSKFNEKKINIEKTSTFEGGVAYSKSLEDEWTNAIFSSVLQPRFYESSEEQESKFIDLTNKMVDKYSPELVGSAAVFSRNELGMRSISELTAAILNKHQWEGKRRFYSKYFHRPDGVGEVFAAVDHLGDKKSHALIRGAADYLSSLSDYQISKYPMTKHTYNMHDIINLTHAKSDVIDRYQKGLLESPDTWEVKISSAESDEVRESEWKRLVEEKKLGYLALLRNLRNICKCSFATSIWISEYLVPQIVNEVAIKKSLVWPLQIYTAWKILHREGIGLGVEAALSEAFTLSTKNMPYLEGNTLVVLDVSGSMESNFSKNSSLTIKEVCAVYASAFLVSEFRNNVDFIKFGSRAKFFDRDIFTSGNNFTLISMLAENENLGYSTEIRWVFDIVNKHYDRVFLFSDMQVMDSVYGGYWASDSAQHYWESYVNEYGKSHMYSFDLGNYHNQILSKRSDISYITALTDVVFKIIEIQENETKSLLDIVRDYVY